MNRSPKEKKQPGSSRQVLRPTAFLIGRFLRPYWKAVVVLIVINVAVGFLLTARPLILAPALDIFAENKTVPATGIADISLNNFGPTLTARLGLDARDVVFVGKIVVFLFLGVTLVIAASKMAAHAILVRTQTAVARDMTLALHAHILDLPLAYFHKRRAGELVSRLTHDAVKTSGSLDAVVRGILQSVAQLLVVMIVLVRTDILMSLVILGMGGVHLLITRLLGTRVRRFSTELSDRHGGVAASLMESIGGIRTVKSFSAEAYEKRKLGSEMESLRRKWIRSSVIAYIETPARMAADAVIIGIILLIIFHSIRDGRLTIQAAVLFLYLSQQAVGPLSALFSQALGMHILAGGAARIVEMFETKSSIPDGSAVGGPLQDRIVVQNASFAYEKGRRALEGVCVEIKRGEMAAVVGPSGSGKSTLADLILRFYDVQEGAIAYDGRDIREFRQSAYRRNFGVVAQDSFLFNGTIAENVTYGRPANEEDLRRALWIANAEEFVSRLPRGAETVVGDRGVRLSGGQRQRIAIARAVYSRPEILVLDEATSALDSEAERAVQKAIDRIASEMTIIVIAHRLSTILHADKIIVLSNGRVEAIGRHEDVLRKSPTYAKLYGIQFGSWEPQGEKAEAPL
jgi:subfamily B ATP-binding cassette protein MsbA